MAINEIIGLHNGALSMIDKRGYLQHSNKPNYFNFFGLEDSYVNNSSSLIDEKQARKFVTEYLNTDSTGKKTTKIDMAYWIVDTCRLSACKNYWIIKGNTQGCLTYNLSGYCLAGNNGLVLDRRNGELTSCGGMQFPDDYIQRTADFTKAEGKFYVLGHKYAHDTKAILRFKNFFNITSLQAKKLLNHYQYLFVGEKQDLVYAKETLISANLHFEILLVDELPENIIDITNRSLYFGNEFQTVVRDFV